MKVYKIKLSKKDAWYERRDLIEDKPMLKDERDHGYLPGHAYIFQNQTDLDMFQQIYGHLDHINICNASTVTEQAN